MKLASILNENSFHVVKNVKSKDDQARITVTDMRQAPVHVQSWASRVVDESDFWSGGYVEVEVEGRDFSAISELSSELLQFVGKSVTDKRLLFVALFTTSPSKQYHTTKLCSTLAKQLKWEKMKDRNYFLVYDPSTHLSH